MPKVISIIVSDKCIDTIPCTHEYILIEYEGGKSEQMTKKNGVDIFNLYNDNGFDVPDHFKKYIPKKVRNKISSNNKSKYASEHENPDSHNIDLSDYIDTTNSIDSKIEKCFGVIKSKRKNLDTQISKVNEALTWIESDEIEFSNENKEDSDDTYKREPAKKFKIENTIQIDIIRDETEKVTTGYYLLNFFLFKLKPEINN